MAKIALLTYSLGFGGIEKVVSDLSNMLSEKGHEVFILLMNEDEAVHPYSGRLLYIGTKWWRNIYRVRRFKQLHKFDFTISSFEYLNVINLLTGSGRMIAMLHNYRFQFEISGSLKDKLLEWLFMRLVRRLHAIVCVSEGIKKKAKNRYPEADIRLIYNSIDIEAVNLKANESPPDTPFNEITFVNVGRLCAQKAQGRLIKAFALVVQKNPDAKLIIIGDGNKRDELNALTESLKLTQNVIFTGFIKNPLPYIKAAKAFVLSSDYEGFGVVLLEALSLGVPVISTDCYSGPREIIAPGTFGQLISGIECCDFGILTSLNEESLSIAMNRIAKSKKYFNCEEKNKSRASDFSFDRAVLAWQDLLTED